MFYVINIYPFFALSFWDYFRTFSKILHILYFIGVTNSEYFMMGFEFKEVTREEYSELSCNLLRIWFSYSIFRVSFLSVFQFIKVFNFITILSQKIRENGDGQFFLIKFE